MGRITNRKKRVRARSVISEETWEILAENISYILIGDERAGREIQRKEEYRTAKEYFNNPRRLKNK